MTSARRAAAAERVCPHCKGTGLIFELNPPALVVAIANTVEGRDFNARELVTHARIVGGPLADALAGMSARRLGKALRKITGQEFSGLRLEHIGSDRDGAILRIVRVLHTRKAGG